jgi:hypothetical protein
VKSGKPFTDPEVRATDPVIGEKDWSGLFAPPDRSLPQAPNSLLKKRPQDELTLEIPEENAGLRSPGGLFQQAAKPSAESEPITPVAVPPEAALPDKPLLPAKLVSPGSAESMHAAGAATARETSWLFGAITVVGPTA